ncbi:hypothetical protein F8M41_005527 [Gigaspora margarita]|uniref:Uncharacterized protein n=1 Tax=Gigaspora margarita TaxID=4874 RepID=A0A8H4AX60_GIGMA|nr:hypothetical protein F8M41_005527 [Gigaspora margarita]
MEFCNNYYQNDISIKKDIPKEWGQEIERGLKTVDVKLIINGIDFEDVNQAGSSSCHSQNLSPKEVGFPSRL